MKVLLLEDHALFREGLGLILERLAEDVCLLEAETNSAALSLAREHSDFDLMLLDYNLPDGNSLDCLFSLMEITPETPKILLSAEQNPEIIKAALAVGARGFITKNASSNVMLSAIQLVMSGGLYVPPEMLTQNHLSADTHANPSLSAIGNSVEAAKAALGVHPSSNTLTGRQNDVLAEMLKGLSNKEIARELNMSPSTVKVHVAAILREFNVKNRIQAVNYARANQLL